MEKASVVLVLGVLALAACGDDDDSGASKKPPPRAAATTMDDAARKDGGATRARKGTTITVGDSEFGTMLFDSRKQAIYIFQRDRNDQTVCYGECAVAWPPVLTKGEPNAGDGVRRSLLGSIERRDGKRQVTYAGKPLYFYAHEQPGEVRCHNVDLNGGLWWVVGPDGKRRP
jgi:predicted lipoprotein with Yx(FWY)xxD motif